MDSIFKRESTWIDRINSTSTYNILIKLNSEKRVEKWKKIIKEYDVWISSPLHRLKLEYSIYKGIPSVLRPYIWPLFLNIENYDLHQNIINEFETILKVDDRKLSKEILKDIKRALPRNQKEVTDNMILEDDLFQVLKVISLCDLQIGYHQSFAPLASFLLRIFNKYKAYHVLRTLANNQLKGYFQNDLEGYIDDCCTMDGYIEVHLNSFYQIMIETKSRSLLFCTAWFSCLFVRTFPIEIVKLIWDRYLYFGKKVVFAVALSLIETLFPIDEPVYYSQSESHKLLEKMNGFHQNPNIDFTIFLESTEKYMYKLFN